MDRIKLTREGIAHKVFNRIVVRYSSALVECDSITFAKTCNHRIKGVKIVKLSNDEK
jgi:hypothetical protein